MANEIYKIFLAEDDETIVHIDGGGGGGGGEPAQYLKDATNTSNKLIITKKDGSQIATNVVPNITGSAGQALVINDTGNDLTWGPAPSNWATTENKPFESISGTGHLDKTAEGGLFVETMTGEMGSSWEDNTAPASAGSIYAVVGNIQALLEDIG